MRKESRFLSHFHTVEKCRATCIRMKKESRDLVASAGHYFVGKLRKEFTSPIAKYTSLGISDMTFFARCPVDH